MRKAALTALLVVAAFLFGRLLAPAPSTPPVASAPAARQAGPDSKNAAADARIVQAFHAERGDLLVESSGTVIKLLPDDRDGSRHQRFLIRLSNGHSLLVAHNIDLAPRVEGLQTGDVVAFKGEYEWNGKGGVIHWTHHDPDGRRAGGWLRHRGRIYQ